MSATISASTFRPMLLRQRQLCAELSVSKAHLRRLVRSGGFPPPLRIGARIVAWAWTDIDVWLAALKHAK